MRYKVFLLLLLTTSLLLLVTCQSAGDSTATGAATPLPTPTSGEQSTEEATSSPLEATGSPQPSPPATTREKQVESLSSPAAAPSRPATAPLRPLATDTPRSPTATPSPARGGGVVVGGLGRPDTLNPLLAETETSRALTRLLFDGLLAYNPHSGRLTPNLAERWQVSSEAQTITFTLRTDARWHDGQPVTADDVAFTLQAIRDPALDSLYRPRLEHVVGAIALDDETVVVNLDQAHCPSLAALGEAPIVPRHLLAGSDLLTTTFGSAPIGSGPFVFADWTPEGQVYLVANGDYWDGTPYLDAWSYRPFGTADELQEALERGQIQVALMPPGRLPVANGLLSSLSVYRYPAPEFLFVAFNNDHPVLGDERVRLALSMAIDRGQLLDQTLNGAGDLIAASLPATHWAADARLEPPPYDPDSARQLLAEAGWSDSDGDGWLDRGGERLRLPVRTNGGNRLREDVATLVAGYYRAIGVDASVELVIWGAVLDDLFTHDFEIIVFGWPLSAEPDQRRWWLSTENEIGIGYNFVSFANEEVDRWLEEALAVPGCDPDRRAQHYQPVQRTLAQERPYDFLFVPYAAVLTQPRLHGLVAGPFAGPLESAVAWYLAP